METQELVGPDLKDEKNRTLVHCRLDRYRSWIDPVRHIQQTSKLCGNLHFNAEKKLNKQAEYARLVCLPLVAFAAAAPLATEIEWFKAHQRSLIAKLCMSVASVIGAHFVTKANDLTERASKHKEAGKSWMVLNSYAEDFSNRLTAAIPTALPVGRLEKHWLALKQQKDAMHGGVTIPAWRDKDLNADKAVIKKYRDGLVRTSQAQFDAIDAVFGQANLPLPVREAEKLGMSTDIGAASDRANLPVNPGKQTAST